MPNLPSVRFGIRIVDRWRWDMIGREYLRAFLEAEYPTKAIPTVMGDLGTAEWEDVRAAFITVTGDGPHDLKDVSLEKGKFLNVVCGWGDDFERFWTQDVLANIAITACHPKTFEPKDKPGLLKYDLILTSADDLVLMQLDFPEAIKKIEPCKPKAAPLKFVLDRFLAKRSAK